MQLSTTWEILIRTIPAVIVILSGVMKITGSPQIATALTRVGVLQYMKLLGITEVIAAVLFILPATNAIGFLLLVGYFSGALATDLSHKNPVRMPLIILLVIVVTEFITNGALFLS